MSPKQILTIFLTISWAFTNVVSASHHAAPAPAVDCSTVVLNMVDCLSYVSSGSTVSKPEGTCCSGLKTVLKSKCLCEAFKNSAQFGFCLNVTKVLALPSACKITAPSVSNCGAPTTPKEKQRKQKRVEDPDEPKRKEKRQKGGNSGILAPIPILDALVKFIGTGETAL